MARVLIVDDSLVALKFLRGIILSLGHTVVGEANNGIQAIAAYERLKPDIVTMDLAMNGIDGAETTSKIIADFPEARIVVVSARQERKVIVDALERGARHFIIKPVTSQKLAVVFDNVLKQTFNKHEHLERINKMKEAGGLILDTSPHTSESRPQKAARVLIVDDSAIARKFLREIVTSLGHVVSGEAANGAQAFIEFTKLKPDVVTMDLMMYGLGGAEATSKIIAAYPEARIIVISAMEDRQTILDALERGARHFIIKPINKEKVSTVLNNVLNQKFDLKNHMKRVHMLQDMEEPLFPGNKYLQPYVISLQENNLVHIEINQSLTLTSCQTLFLELEEHLTETPRVLLDFGEMSKLDSGILVKFNEFIRNVDKHGGVVRAVSNNEKFVDYIAGVQQVDSPNLMADILRYLAN